MKTLVSTDSLHTLASHQRFTHDGAELHYWLLGPTQAPLVVLNHGVAGDHHMFDPVLAPLAATYRVLLWDMRGHGQSTTDRLFDLGLAVDDLAALLDQIGAQRCVLIGVSAGAVVAQLFAARHGERLMGLGLLSSTPLWGPHSRWRTVQDNMLTAFLHLAPYWLIVGQASGLLSVRSDVHPYIVRSMEAMGKQHFLAVWESILRWSKRPMPVDFPRPLLLAHGAYDQIGRIKAAALVWKTLYPDAHYDVIPGAGHNVTQDNPNYCITMLRAFVHKAVHSHNGWRMAKAVA